MGVGAARCFHSPRLLVRVRCGSRAVRGACVCVWLEWQTLPILLHASAYLRLRRLRVLASRVRSGYFVLLLLRHVVSVRSVHGSFVLL